MPIGSEVSVATANSYIEDFIDNYYDTGDFPVKSFTMDAQLIRDYLDDTDIENVKFMLGERTVGTDKQLTLVVAGYDSANKYVLTTNAKVLEDMEPCPNSCPSGDAGNDLII